MPDVHDESLDVRIVRRYLAGDTQAFAEIVDLHQRSLRGFLWTVLGDRDLTEDVLQEVFFLASRRLASFRFDSKLSTWLHAIAVREALRMRRRMQRWWRQWIPLEMVEPRICPVSDPLRSAAALDEALHYLAHLAPRPRAAYALWIQGFGYDDIASILVARPGTVASWIHRARASIAERVAAEAAEPASAVLGKEADA
jgi:RNA polymerase sigma-70 factor, ECF subfamily